MTPDRRPTVSDDIVQLSRVEAPEFYLSALLAPRAARSDLIVAAAFCGEIQRIWRTVSEPHLGEIRLQWWRDALLCKDGAAGTGHATADAFRGVMARRAVSSDTLERYFDAYADALYQAPPDTEADQLQRIEAMYGPPFEFAAACLGYADADGATAMAAVARAYGLMRVAVTLPYAMQQGRLPLVIAAEPDALPDDGPETATVSGQDGARDQLSPAEALLDISGPFKKHLAATRAALPFARDAFRRSPKPMRTALLPIAVVEPHLQVLQNSDHRPDRDLAEISPLTRALRLWRAHVTGRL